LDGRDVRVEGYPHGNFVGPTIIEAATTMTCYRYVLITLLSPYRLQLNPHSTAVKKYLGLYS
jgi:hypothetical protein